MQLVSPPFPSPSAPLGHLTFVSPRNSEEREGRERDRGREERKRERKEERKKERQEERKGGKVTLSERGKKEKI